MIGMTAKERQQRGLPGMRRRRRELGLSKTALAEILGTSRQNISYWESGKNWPVGYWIPAIAEALHCSTDELYREEEGDDAE